MIVARGRRGQGSLEFLMTYGWAIMVLIVVFVVAWQWGLFDVGGRVPDGRFGFWGLDAHDYNYHSNGVIDISLLNSVGANVTLIEVNASKASGEVQCRIGNNVIKDLATKPVIERGENIIINCPLDPLDPGDSFESYVKIRYNESRSGSYEFYSSGKVWGSVNP